MCLVIMKLKAYSKLQHVGVSNWAKVTMLILRMFLLECTLRENCPEADPLPSAYDDICDFSLNDQKSENLDGIAAVLTSRPYKRYLAE